MRQLGLVFVVFLVNVLTLVPAMAATDCYRGTPSNFFHHLASPSDPGHVDIWINFKDGGGPLSVNTGSSNVNAVNENAVHLLVTAAHTAINTGGGLTIRYKESGLTCPPAGVRSDIKGFYVIPPATGSADEGTGGDVQPPLDSDPWAK